MFFLVCHGLSQLLIQFDSFQKPTNEGIRVSSFELNRLWNDWLLRSGGSHQERSGPRGSSVAVSSDVVWSVIALSIHSLHPREASLALFHE